MGCTRKCTPSKSKYRQNVNIFIILYICATSICEKSESVKSLEKYKQHVEYVGRNSYLYIYIQFFSSWNLYRWSALYLYGMNLNSVLLNNKNIAPVPTKPAYVTGPNLALYKGSKSRQYLLDFLWPYNNIITTITMLQKVKFLEEHIIVHP